MDPEQLRRLIAQLQAQQGGGMDAGMVQGLTPQQQTMDLPMQRPADPTIDPRMVMPNPLAPGMDREDMMRRALMAAMSGQLGMMGQ